MRTVGIIAEYNPFHEGHAYHIQKTREITQADYVITVISGDFVQRGEPAILDKYTRADMALSMGADVVLELPVSYATASAERFAFGGVSLLYGLGCVDLISCGCEAIHSPEILSGIVKELARILTMEPEAYRSSLKEKQKGGMGFPAAREQALLEYLSSMEGITQEKLKIFSSLLSSPNGILAIEYQKALLRLNSNTELILISRKGSYHEESLSLPQSEYASATALRKEIMTDGLEGVFPHVPKSLRSLYQKNPYPMGKEDFNILLAYALLQHKEKDWTLIQDMTPDLENRIKKEQDSYRDWNSFTRQVHSKNLTDSHINRALLHLLLQIPKRSDPKDNEVAYARILGFRKEAAPLLHEMKIKGQIPLITKMAHVKGLYSGLEEDIMASHLYEMVRSAKYGISRQNEYTKGLLVR